MTAHDYRDSHNTETRFSGLPISEGVAVGRVCLLNERRHANLPLDKVSSDGKDRERKRFEEAVAVVGAQLDALVHDVAERVGRTEAEIFKVQRTILQDADLQKKIVHAIETGDINAEVAISRTLDVYETRIAEVDDEYIRERATDIGELRRRLLDALGNTHPSLQCDGQERCQRGRDRIIIAEQLTPGLTVELDTKRTIGFVTERGGPASHAAILARALGIPAVSGIDGVHGLISCGTEVLIDGDTGEVIVWPTEQTLARYPVWGCQTKRPVAAVEPVPNLRVMANISLASEVSEAVEMRAEGIGLYRTEFELIAAGRALNEDEQFERYVAVGKTMKGGPVTFRLFDVGGDKAAPFLDLPEESNPCLGLRGSRLLLARPELLRAQARALARASTYGLVRVLYPMIIDSEQFLSLKARFLESIRDLPVGNLEHGVMFEVPSACLGAREILEVADFGSIGTNDLVQYLFAVDRNNELVAGDYGPDKPVLWSLIGDLVRAAHEAGRSLSVCGEAVGSPELIGKFMDAGIQTVSVSARLIPGLRRAAHSHCGRTVLSQTDRRREGGARQNKWEWQDE